MPHLTIDYSSRLAAVLDAGVLVKELHPLVLEESGSAGVCKTLVRPVDTYVGDTSNGETAFLHIEVGLLAGRPEHQRARLSERVLALAGGHLRAAGVPEAVVSVEVRELAGSYRLSTVTTAGG
ncbi:5-carboxymethyl-2-hydroxymuconate Delta-isomerase [Streptomyces sp. WELS2]|uniref:5-carboxymethyl-2-hydroxymuconate Delta-isomerase n=1 Tax=Streptomyces sp. WELS2 TaxID=2749435 RepID=UPI0015F1088C|nr:5-carboxymethyl-2-hydroxymuconate delta isomerase [Streptomyces sp. WELS2]